MSRGADAKALSAPAHSMYSAVTHHPGSRAIKTLVLFLSLVASGASFAQFFDGNDLKQGCAAEEQSFGAGLCLGFIVGVIDGKKLCMSEEVDLGQIRRVVKLHLKMHPEELKYTAESIVQRAIERNYPCEDDS